MGSDLGESLSIIQAIQLILAPAVMINACGLLLLATSNRYSVVLNRIRLLNDEKRKLVKKAGEKAFEESLRLESVVRQIDHLMARAKLVRNSVMCYTGAIALFIVTSLLIGVSFFSELLRSNVLITLTFLVGMVSVFAGVLYSFLDTKKGYEVVRFDVQVDE
ncbi:MAG: DUF2721 domain-containing protein [Ignavibacteria bacterium]|nr:DUF2721 domain-containing protein [Ignavibacteria bacterium]